MSAPQPGRLKPSRRTPVVQLTLPADLVAAIDRWAAAQGRRRRGERVSRSRAVRELCAAALDREDASGPPARNVRIYRLGAEPADGEIIERMTAGARVALVSELSAAAYALRGENDVPGVRRDLVRIVRRRC